MVNAQPLGKDCCLSRYFVAPNTTDFYTSTFSETSKLTKGSPLHLGVLSIILKHFPPIFFFQFKPVFAYLLIFPPFLVNFC